MTHQHITIKFNKNTWDEYHNFINRYQVNTAETHYPEFSSRLIPTGFFPNRYNNSIVTIWGKEADRCVYEIKLK